MFGGWGKKDKGEKVAADDKGKEKSEKQILGESSLGSSEAGPSQPALVPVPNAYPSIPPPAYTAVPSSVNVPLAFPVSTGGVSNCIGIPAMRFDTMTSYQEDGLTHATVVTQGAILDHPILIQCPFCRIPVTTQTEPVTGCLTWLCCLGISAVGLVYGCCLVPFCTKRLRDVEHHCPKCKNLIALYKRI